MSKILFTIIVLVFSFSTLLAQNTNTTEQTNYSESKPYQPRDFKVDEAKSKKVKKSKKESNDKKAISTTANNDQNIKIPLFVYDRSGKPVADLQNSDIKLFVDGNEQPIASFEQTRKPLNLLLILDTSPSTTIDKKGIKNFVSKLIESLNPDDKLQIIKFNDAVDVLNEATNDRKILEKTVNKVEMGDGTSIYDAVQNIFQKITDNANEPQAIILLTDGVDTTSQKANYFTSLIEAEKRGVAVFPFYLDTFDSNQKNKPLLVNTMITPTLGRVIGISKEEYILGRMYLQDIAELSGGRIFSVKNLEEIKTDEFKKLLPQFNPQYYISINAQETAAVFQRKQIKVRVNRPNLTVQARGSYIIGEN